MVKVKHIDSRVSKMTGSNKNTKAKNKNVYIIYARYKTGKLEYLGTYINTLDEISNALGSDDYELVVYRHKIDKLDDNSTKVHRTPITVIDEKPMKFRPSENIESLVQDIMCECDIVCRTVAGSCIPEFSQYVKEG